jgi:hypothetical protein
MFDRPRPDPSADQGDRSDFSSPAGKEPLFGRNIGELLELRARQAVF